MARPENSIQFGKVPYEMITRGAYRDLSQSERGVVLSIAAHVNGSTWTAELSYPTIAFEAGVSDRTAERVVVRLEEKHCLTVERRKGRGNCNRYTLVTKPDSLGDGFSSPKGDTIGDGFSSPKGDTMTDGFSKQKPDKSSHKTRHSETENPTKSTLKPDNLSVGGTEEQKEQQNSRAADAAAAAVGDESKKLREGKPEGDVIDALKAVGIGEPKRRELARLWGGIDGAPQRIREIAAEVTERGKGTGALVLQLEALAHAERERARNRHASEKARRESRLAEETDKQRFERERRITEAFFASLTASEVARAKADVMKAAGRLQREAWRNANPRECCTLKVAICQHVRSERDGAILG